ncbi:endophilin-A3 isoform X7 [Ovis aries]|uniref:endophilin-A3 isoform X7 n=1 Tax=Ovis aries TaxID=9940 RepID=UPI00072F8DAC|nr:endophilin-A3 isoform X7 [Ovis aries]
MSVAGLKKQFHKASQLFSEKISGVEGTKLDDEFLDMERKIDITNKAVAEILSKATEYLQPNPAYRAKLGMLNTVSKIRGQVKTTGYPQTEGLLGDCMLKYGKELGEGSTFGSALIEVGESMKLMAEVKDSLDINVKQTFIDPLQLLQDKDLKEIGHHLKKLEGRRLDYDYKKKRVGRTSQPAGRVCRGRFRLSQTVHRDSAGAAEQATDEDIGCIQRPQARIQATAHKKESQRAQWGVHRRLSKDNRAQTLGTWTSAGVLCRLSYLAACEIFRTRDGTCVPCIGRWILNHWTNREVPLISFLIVPSHLYSQVLLFV